MAAIPPRPEQQIINRIYAAIEKANQKPDIYLGRLGSSFIGQECTRQIWLNWRGFARSEFGGRMLRLFETGHLEEARIVENLRNAGLAVWDKQDNGKQYEYADDSGHFVTKIDGIVKDVPDSSERHLLEVKTHNKTNFATLLKKGVKEAKPTHYAQVQISMALAKFDKALYVALCKEDEQFYVEIIETDISEQNRLKAKIDKLLEARLRPAGISDDGTAFGCKFCDMKAVCTKQIEPMYHCRTCRMCEPGQEGKWICDLNKETLSIDRQKLACEHWEPL